MFNIVKTAAEVAVFTVNSHSLNMEWREKMAKQPIALIIMDGYGINKTVEGNAIAAAKKPNLDKYFTMTPFIFFFLISLSIFLYLGLSKSVPV